MKKILGILVLGLFLITPSQADDIRDFQIEGMSIWDSLLDYYSEDKIENFYNYDDLPSNMKFRIVEFSINESDKENYDGMQIYYKPDDKNFIIHGFSGFIECPNINCEKKLKEILNDLSSLFKNSEIIGGEKYKAPDDKSGKSIVINYDIELTNGFVTLQYIDWSDEVEWIDNIRVEISTNEVYEWSKSGFGAVRY